MWAEYNAAGIVRGKCAACGVAVGPRSWKCENCQRKRYREYKHTYQREWYARNSEKRREYTRIWGKKRRTGHYYPAYREMRIRAGLKKYGLTPIRYDEMLLAQGGVCEICKKSPEDKLRGRLYVDHDHATGLVRSLLCKKCNIAIGLLGEDTVVFGSAVAYVQKWIKQ